jgi:hypothetical protein
MRPVATASKKIPTYNKDFLPNFVAKKLVAKLVSSFCVGMSTGISIASCGLVAWLKIGPQYILIAFTPDICCVKAM